MDLASEVLEEPLELVDRAVGGRQELGRVVAAGLDPPHVVELGDELPAISLGPPGDRHCVAALEPHA